jgi:thiol:disulfide interchange protein DsbD
MSFDALPLGEPWAAIPLLFGAGVLASTLPCIYPMIPITAAILGGTGSEDRSRRGTVAATLLFVLGLSLVYASLGLLAGLTGTLFGTVSASPWAYFLMGNLLLVFGLMMLDVVPLPMPQRLLVWAGTKGASSYPAIFVMGATSGLVAAPCGAPAFAGVLTWVAGTQSPVWGFIYLFVFSLGMTAILVLVGLFSGLAGRLPRAGRWTVWVKRVGAVVLFGMAEYYFVRMGLVL